MLTCLLRMNDFGKQQFARLFKLLYHRFCAFHVDIIYPLIKLNTIQINDNKIA